MTNTLAYYKYVKLTAIFFLILGPGANVVNFFNPYLLIFGVNYSLVILQAFFSLVYGAYPSEAVFRRFTLAWGPGLTNKH